MNLGG